MVVVAFNRLQPLSGQSAHGPRRKAVGARQLRPDEQAETVGPVEVAGVFELLMFADAVESQRLGEFDIFAERRVVRSREQRVVPVTLVERQP